jgi:cleavage stimulation factor subunit 3
LTQKPETTPRAKPLYLFFHDYESKYGTLDSIKKLEQRMKDLFPDDPSLKLFVHRFQYTNAVNQTFDPTVYRPIISPATQMKLGGPVISIEKSPEPSVQQSPALPSIPLGNNSPKRPFVPDLSDREPPRKIQRGESPLKGAAGRRLDAARRRAGDTPQHAAAQAPQHSLPRDVNFLLSVLPKRELSQNMNPQIIPAGMVHLLRTVDLNRVDWQTANLKAAGPGLLQPQLQPPRQQVPPPIQQMPSYPPPPMGVPPPQQMQNMYSPASQYPPAVQYAPATQYAYPPAMNGMSHFSNGAPSPGSQNTFSYNTAPYQYPPR